MNDYEYDRDYDRECDCECDCENKKCRTPEYCCVDRKCVIRPNRTLMKCSNSGAVTLPANTAAGTTFNLTNLNLDTRKFHNPCIKFEFASNIVTTAASLTLNFQIFKQCKNQLNPIPVGPVWAFSRQLTSFDEADAFTFLVCDCDSCDDGCCNYSVVMTVAGILTTGVTSVNNATLSAIVVDNTEF